MRPLVQRVTAAPATARLSRPVRWAPPLAWASLILIATSIPIPGSFASASPSGADKVVHGALYAVLAWLSCRAASVWSPRAALAIIVATALFATVDEWHQRFIPGRTPAVADWIADLLGVGVGVLGFHTARRRRESAL